MTILDNDSDFDLQLEMPRAKPRSFFISLNYRLSTLGQAIIGPERMLRLFLNGSWLWWRLAYEISARAYGDVFYVRGRALDEDLLRSLIPEGASFLDVGCGFGEWSRIAAKYARHVVGIDFDSSKIERARSLTVDENVEYRIGDLTSELGDRMFDVALLSHVIEHVSDADALLSELRGVASNIIVEVPDFENDPLNWVRAKQNCPFYTDGDHVREYTMATLSDQLERNGWRATEIKRRHGMLLAVAENFNDTRPNELENGSN